MTEAATSRKITQELDRLQKQITIKLERYYKQHINGAQLPVEFIRQNDKEIKDIIAETVQASWLFGHTIISDVLAKKITISAKDGHGIEVLVPEFEEQFWQLSHKLLTRETEYKVEEGQLSLLDEFNVHAAFVGIGLWFAYFAYNQSISSKSEELGNIKLKFVTRENCIDTQICLPLNGHIFDIGSVTHNPPLHKHCKCRLIPVRV